MGQTDGLVSAYQLLDYSAQRILSHNMAYTSSQEILVEIVPIPNLEKARASEIIKVRVPPLYNQLAFALLSKRVPIQVYADSSFGLARGDLRILQEAGIFYEVE
jgi:hypothetical protein